MTQPTTARFGKFRVFLGDASSPIVYTAPCGFTSKSLTLSKNLSEVTIPDCDDPDAPFWVARDTQSLTAEISGEGVMASQSIDSWLDAWEDTDSVPAKVEIEFSGLLVTWTGLMHVATVTAGAEQGGRVTCNIQMQSDGQLTRQMTP